jgi:alkylation response protein AidB-like acyl-CoA dehydrogenase
MFIMMNAARLSVGLEGVAVAERAYQRASRWSRERMQGRVVGGSGAKTLAHRPASRREADAAHDEVAHRGDARARLLDLRAPRPGAQARRRRGAEALQAMVDLLIPVVKGWSTENGIDVASLGIQVHGGMGFIEETGAAQHLRDARITTIYEGTTGIQANDLVGRKVGASRARRCWR